MKDNISNKWIYIVLVTLAIAGSISDRSDSKKNRTYIY